MSAPYVIVGVPVAKGPCRQGIGGREATHSVSTASGARRDPKDCACRSSRISAWSAGSGWRSIDRLMNRNVVLHE